MKYKQLELSANLDQELRKFHLFTALNNQEFAQIRESLQLIRLEDGEYLFKQGEPAEHFFMLKNGFIKLLRLSVAGEEKIFDLISPGQTFAEAMMFMPDAVYPVTAQALNESAILCFDSKVFISIIKESSETSFQFMFHISKRLHMCINEIDNLTLQNATYRIVNYLLYQIPDDNKNAYEINFPIPKQVIASRLSIKPETFSRILRDLNKIGLIVVKGRTIYIHNVDRLRLYSIGALSNI
jgi:CRP-like cAMP-binding protein